MAGVVRSRLGAPPSIRFLAGFRRDGEDFQRTGEPGVKRVRRTAEEPAGPSRWPPARHENAIGPAGPGFAGEYLAEIPVGDEVGGAPAPRGQRVHRFPEDSSQSRRSPPPIHSRPAIRAVRSGRILPWDGIPRHDQPEQGAFGPCPGGGFPPGDGRVPASVHGDQDRTRGTGSARAVPAKADRDRPRPMHARPPSQREQVGSPSGGPFEESGGKRSVPEFHIDPPSRKPFR